MAATSKFDFASGSPDRPIYPCGRGGSHSAASLSGNYRVPFAVPGISRDRATLTHGDVLKFLHGLRFDCKQLAEVNKLPRQGDINSVLLSAKQQFASSLEELKRVKIDLHDNSVRARDRGKMLNETALRFDKSFQNILRNKRSQSVVPSRKKAKSLPTDHTVFGGIAKTGTQSQTSAFDNETSKSEGKIKFIATNKRPRTSVLHMDVHANALGRSQGSVQRDIETPGSANTVQSEEKDQILSNCIDNKEKSSMKKKRSGIKSEVFPSTYLNRPLDGDQEPERVIEQRLNTDAKSRCGTAHGFRSKPSHGVFGVGKVKTSQKAVLRTRSTRKRDQTNGSHLDDRRDHVVSSDKERVNVETFIWSTVCGNNCSSLSSTMNTSTVTQASRSGPGAISKVSPSVHRSKRVFDEELSQDLSKLQAGVNNFKHTSVRSSSPPGWQWAGQRHQKVPRVSRRSILVPSLLVHDETPALDTDSNISGSDNGSQFQRHSSSNSLHQVKVKGEHFSSALLSESKESEVAGITSKNKPKKSVDMDEKGGQNVPEAMAQVLPSRKNKLPGEELGLGGGIRRQGRSVRGISSTRSGNPLSVGKREDSITVKQLRSSKPSLDEIESCPPTKELSWPRRSVNAGVTNGESDNWHEELLVAANAAVSTGKVCSGTFWRQIESFFGLVSFKDIAYIKQQGDSLPSPIDDPALEDDFTSVTGEFSFIGDGGDDLFSNEAERVEHFLEQSVPGKRICNEPFLFQRILSAFIIEEEDVDFCEKGEYFEIDAYGSRCVSDMEFNCDSWNQRLFGNIQTVGRPASNGNRTTPTRRYLDELEIGDLFDSADVMADTNVEAISNCGHSLNGFHPDQVLMSSTACTQSQYTQMSIDERLLLEIQSIGLIPEQMGDCEDINEDIRILQKKLHGQVLKNKELLYILEKSVTEARHIQERDVERRAFDKLVGLAYEKYMKCWGPNASCGKGMRGEITKQAAMSFLKQTIEQCRKFENTGKSCFNEAVFKDVFCSGSSLVKNVESSISKKEREPSKIFTDPPISSSEITDPDALGSIHIPSLISRPGQNMDSDKKYSSEDFLSVNHCSEQIPEKDDAASNRMEKRGLLLDNVVGGTVGTVIRGPSCVESSLLSGAKGRRGERDKEGTSHNKDMQSRNFTVKTGQPSLKGERKSKTKPKQRTVQLSASINCVLGKTQKILSIQESRELLTKISAKKNDDLSLDIAPYSKSIDLSNPQLSEMDALGVSDDLGEQGQDLASWLNIGDDVLQDDDVLGLEIPMDDLCGLKMIL